MKRERRQLTRAEWKAITSKHPTVRKIRRPEPAEIPGGRKTDAPIREGD